MSNVEETPSSTADPTDAAKPQRPESDTPQTRHVELRGRAAARVAASASVDNHASSQTDTFDQFDGSGETQRLTPRIRTDSILDI